MLLRYGWVEVVKNWRMPSTRGGVKGGVKGVSWGGDSEKSRFRCALTWIQEAQGQVEPRSADQEAAGAGFKELSSVPIRCGCLGLYPSPARVLPCLRFRVCREELSGFPAGQNVQYPYTRAEDPRRGEENDPDECLLLAELGRGNAEDGAAKEESYAPVSVVTVRCWVMLGSSKMGAVDTVADPLLFRNYNPHMDHEDLMVVLSSCCALLVMLILRNCVI
eukprot:750422-Hanusia_phi.AAC.2